MEVTATKKFNSYNYFKLPTGLKGLPLGTQFVIGDIFSFTGKSKQGKELDCRRTYNTFKERLGYSRATIGRGLKWGKENGVIKKDKEKGYVCELGNFADSDFLRLPNFIREEEFNVHKDKRRKLLPSESDIYAYLFTHCANNKHKKKVCEISISKLAEVLDMSEKTVYKGLWTLLRAKLIYRPKIDKGINAYKVSRYTLNTKLLREHGIYIGANEKKPEPEPKKPEAKATAEERKQYYSNLRYRAQLIAERNLETVRRIDEQFRQADDTIRNIAPALALATVSGHTEEIVTLQVLHGEAMRIKATRARILGYMLDSFEPQYKCKCCEDTGYKLTDGTVCDCFPPGGVF